MSDPRWPQGPHTPPPGTWGQPPVQQGPSNGWPAPTQYGQSPPGVWGQPPQQQGVPWPVPTRPVAPTNSTRTVGIVLVGLVVITVFVYRVVNVVHTAQAVQEAVRATNSLQAPTEASDLPSVPQGYPPSPVVAQPAAVPTGVGGCDVPAEEESDKDFCARCNNSVVFCEAMSAASRNAQTISVPPTTTPDPACDTPQENETFEHFSERCHLNDLQTPTPTTANQNAVISEPPLVLHRGRVVLIASESSVTRGALSLAEVLPRVRSRLTAIRTCYERQLRTNPHLAGHVRVRSNVCQAGGVGRVQSSVGSGMSGVDGCVAGVIRGTTFSNPGNACSALVTSFAFEPAL